MTLLTLTLPVHPPLDCTCVFNFVLLSVLNPMYSLDKSSDLKLNKMEPNTLIRGYPAIN